VAELSAKLDVYEVILETYKFLAGDVNIVSCVPSRVFDATSPDSAPVGQEFTLADLCHSSHAPMFGMGGIAVVMSESRPNVTRLLNLPARESLVNRATCLILHSWWNEFMLSAEEIKSTHSKRNWNDTEGGDVPSQSRDDLVF
jgi:hypothetical protein